MKRRPSIALRLALGLTAGLALLWIGAAAISVAVMQHELNEAYDDSLRQSALRLLPLALHDLRDHDDRPGRLVVSESDGDDDDDDSPTDGMAHDPTFTYLIRDATGALVLRDEHAPVEIDPDHPLEGFGVVGGQRSFALTDDRSGYSIVIIELSDRRLTALRDSIAALGLPLLALVPLMAGGVWLAMRLALRPLEALRRDIAQRDSRNLEPVRSDDHPAELAPIADAVDALLARLKSALDAERAFAARSAHELRTPIAGALAQTQRLADELAGSSGTDRVREIEVALKALSRLAEKLLQLARIEAGFARSDRAVDLRPVLRLVVGDVNASPGAAGRARLDLVDTVSLDAPMDADAFAMALRNLIENGLKHGVPGAPVEVWVDPDGAVHVRNECAPIEPADLARLGQPFVRGDTPSQGTGLGLSIARSILEQAGGRLALHSPAIGQAAGFEAVMHLPRSG